MEEKNSISESKYKSRLFKNIASWLSRHGTALTAVALVAVSAVLGCAEANIIYAGGASNDYGIHGTTSSPSYTGGSGNSPTVYEPGVVGVSLVTYDLADVAQADKSGKAKYEYGGSKNKLKNGTAAVSSTGDPNTVERAKEKYTPPADQKDYYPYWIEMGTTNDGKSIYKYSNSLHHAITSNILAMQTSYEYDDSTMIFVPRVIASNDHHKWIMNETQSVVIGRAKKTKKLSNTAIFYNLDPWYAEKDAGNFSKTSKSVTDGIAGSSKNKAGIYYAELKKYIKNKEKKKTKKSFVTVTSGDSGKKYDICNYSYFANLSTADIKEIIGFKGNSFTSDGQKKLARARQLYSSIANINETSTGQYTTTPEMADVFLRYTTAASLGSDSYGTSMFSKNGIKEGLYGKQKGVRDAANKNMVGSQVLRSIYQSNKRFKSVIASGATKEMDKTKKAVLTNEYNSHYLDLLISGYALALASGDKQVASKWLEGVKIYAKTAADGSDGKSGSAGMENVVIRLDMGMVYATSNEVTYASCGSVINKHYNFSGKVDAFENKKSTNSKSLNKGFIGFAASDDKSGQNYQAHNQEVATKKGVVTKSSYKNAGYGTYYDRLSKAVQNKKSVTGSGQGWYSRMVIMRTTAAYYSMSSKNGPVNSRVYNKLATVELLRMVASNYGVNPRKGTTNGLAWQYGTYAVDGYYWAYSNDTDDSDISFNLTIYSKDVNGKEPAQNGKDIKDTFQSYSMTGKTHTATIKDNLYVKLSPGKDKESKKLFDKVLASDKYHVKIVFENADGTTAASLLDPKIVKSVQQVTDPETGTKYDAKKEVTYYKALNQYDSTNKGSEKGDEQNYNKLVSAKQIGGKDLQANRSLIWRISNADVRTKGFKISGTGSYYVNWKAKVYIMQKSGSGAKKKWTSVINGSSVTKTKPSMSDLKAGGCATTNNVIAQYIYRKDDTEDVNLSSTYESIPEAYAELKEGSIYNETFEAMAGVPSTRSLYFATGGSEFIVNMQAVYDDYYLKEISGGSKNSYRSTRRYKSVFNSTDCEYKKGDTLKSLTAGNTKEETFVADANDRKQEKSVTAEKNSAVNPQGAAGYNTTVNGHDSTTKFHATWTGTIGNNTSRWSQSGSNVSPSGKPCEGGNAGEVYSMSPTPANWDVSAYNTALGQAANWAKKMEQIGKSADGTVYRIDDSDGYKRVYHVGTATIKVTLTGGEKSYDTGSSRSYGGGTYTSSDLVSSAKRTNTSADLGTGWSYTKGNKASASGSHTTDEHGKVTGHSSWSGYKGSVDGKSSSIQYKIEVTFKDGSITAGNYDGKVGESGLKVEKKSGLTQFGAHDLCGACCQHVLPAIEDTWIQKLRFDTIRFTNLKVWKLQEGYAEGMGEIRKTDDGSGSSIEGEAGKAEADAVKKEKEDNKDNTQVVDPDLSDVEGTEAANDKEYDENGDLIVPDYETGDIGDDPDADGEETWTDTSENDLDIVKSKIVRYDPNIFYNIAQADTSKAGRIRYSLQTGQDDDVTWTEFNSDKKLTRTDSCDGQTASHGGSPVVVTANGHKKSWCRGCLYTNSTYSNLRNRHDNAKTGGEGKGEAGEAAKTKTGYTNNTADAVDKTTFEWKRFDKRRKLNCKATVISDFLILQTSSGNESIVYYQDTAETKHHECQENYKDTLWYSKPTDMNNLKKENVSKAKWMWTDKMWTDNPLVKKTSNLNVGSYNGNYSSTSTKYQGTGGNAVVETAFDKDEEKYNHITDTDENGNTLDLAKVTSARIIETKQKQMDDIRTIMQTKSDSIDGNICSPGCGNTYDGTNYDTCGSGSARMGTNTADVYTAPTKQDVWGKYSWIDRIIPSLNGQTDAPEPAQFGNAGLVLVQDGIAQCPTNPNQEYVTGQSHAFFIPLVTYTNFGADKNAETHDITNYTFKYTDKNDSVAGRVGYTMDSIYTNGQTKVNNIVVHDPVSVQGANILTVNKEMDQRVLGDDKSGAAEMNKEANDVTCPGTAEECQYRLLNCQYGKPVRRAAFNVDNAKHSDVEDDDGVVHSYDSIISNILAPGGTYMDVSLADSGFVIKRYDGLEAFEGTSEDDENQPDRYLSGNGSASLAMSWSAMGVDTEEAKSDTYELQGVFNFHNALDSEKALFTTRATKLLAEPDGSLKIMLADGSEYTSTTSPLVKDGKNTIQYHFGMDSVVLSPKKINYKDGSYTVDANTGATVDGKEISFTKTKNSSGDMTNYIGDGIWFGNQDDSTSNDTAYDTVYDCSYSLDNLAVTRLAPEKDANGISYRHTLSCFAGVTEHAKTTQDYYNGISDKKVQYTYNYTGDVQTFTAPADGVYTLEAWGASGGDGYDDSVDRETTSSVAGNGGYSKGNISLKKGQKIYVFVGGAGKYGAGTNRFGGPAGGYNGGGDGGVADSGSGGGMSHISTTNNPATTSWNPDGTLLVAGGGGGADNSGGSRGSDDGRGGNGGGKNGENAYIENIKSTGNATWTPTSGLSLRTGTTLSGNSAVTNGSEQGVFGPYKTYLPGQKVTITVKGDNLTNGYPVVYTNYGRYQTRNYTVEAANSNEYRYSFTVPSGLTSTTNTDGTSADSGQNPYTIWEFCFHARGSSRMRIDSETASCDYNSANQNMGGCGMGGTQGSGYKQGVGESVTFGTDSGGAGGGWYGGYVTNANNGGGAGGSGYTASGLTNTEMKSGVRRGNGLVKITAAGTIDWTRKFDDGYQKQTSENNRHVHTEACMDTPSEGFKIAVDEASNGNTADLGKMLGSAVWGKIKDQLKNCYGSGSGGSAGSVAAGKTYTYDYSGSVKSVTLPAGKYKLEAWGASGGGRNPGKGGYSAGTVTFANETTVYIVAGQSAGTYNGGGIGCHGYGGGATHFATANGELAALSNNKNSVLLVAGGGAGGSSGAGGAGGGANQSGTTGGDGCGTKGEGATVSGPGNAYFSGSFGKGGSNSGWNTCGGGGGLYGGGGSYESYSRNDDDDAGAGGGSGYASSSLTDVSGITGEHSGNGYAKITVIEAHTDYDPDKVFDLVKKATGNNYSLIPDSVTTDGHTIINPFWSCQCIYDGHVCTKHCKTTYVLQCKEPHHKAVNGKIGHYDAGNEICYDACHNDELHKKGAEQANAGKPGTSKPLKFGDFVLLDNYFYIYFPNSGDFYESDDYGIAQTEQRKGKGYTNNYDCTEWTREKWIKFPYSVLYNRNGTFEEHPAGQWFQLEITDKVTNRNVKNNCYDLTSLSERDDGFTYQFYAQLDNHEMSGATIEYAVEAINNQPSPSGSENPYDRDGTLSLDCSQDNSSITNAERAIDLTAKHSAYKQTFVDLISRIGNLTVQDSTDLRFSNLFKRKTNDDKWYIDGIVHAVDKSIQNAYLSWHKNNGDTATDIRGEKVSAYNQWYNTWHTAKWSDVGEDSSRCVSTPLESAKNNIAALRGKSEQLQLGYNLLWDIQVLSRDFADGNVQIEPKYYILDTKKDKLMAVDVWGSRNEDVTLVNEFGLMDKYGTDYFNQQKDKIYDHAMLLNWDDEKARRNYSDEEKAATETASKVLGRTILDANGMPMTQKNPLTGMEEEVVAPLSIPMGDGYREGNAQFLYLNGRTRTFIGNSKVTALHKDINGDDDQELFKEFDAIGNDLGSNGVSEDEYSFCASRWHVTLGLPSSAKFTDVTVDKDGKEQHINPYDMITDEDTGDKIYAYQKYDPDYLKEHGDENRYMILETARITAYGAVYNLRYSQLMDNGSITAANGKTYNFVDSATYPGKANSIPTLLAVYGITNSGRDYETLQTH